MLIKRWLSLLITWRIYIARHKLFIIIFILVAKSNSCHSVSKHCVYVWIIWNYSNLVCVARDIRCTILMMGLREDHQVKSSVSSRLSSLLEWHSNILTRSSSIKAGDPLLPNRCVFELSNLLSLDDQCPLLLLITQNKNIYKLRDDLWD